MLKAMMKKSPARAMIALVGLMGVTAAEAGSLAVPSEKPILTVSGKISETNKFITALFESAML